VTVARPAGRRGPGEAYLLNGHKWFCSAPMSDGFFTVARTEDGPCCFFAPRWRPDGTPNGIEIQRLKDKLGNRANASSEIEYHDAYAVLVGEEGHGVRTILTSSDYTRLDFAIGSAGLIRAALSQALHYADHRSAFGTRLSNCPSRPRCSPTSRSNGRARPTLRSGWPARSTATTTSASGCSAGS
jgi:putative acyl-CoA dehydrogenase